MKTYTVVFTPEAEEQLAQLYRYIAEHASSEIALRYTSAIIEHCEVSFARADGVITFDAALAATGHLVNVSSAL